LEIWFYITLLHLYIWKYCALTKEEYCQCMITVEEFRLAVSVTGHWANIRGVPYYIIYHTMSSPGSRVSRSMNKWPNNFDPRPRRRGWIVHWENLLWHPTAAAASQLSVRLTACGKKILTLSPSKMSIALKNAPLEGDSCPLRYLEWSPNLLCSLRFTRVCTPNQNLGLFNHFP